MNLVTFRAGRRHLPLDFGHIGRPYDDLRRSALRATARLAPPTSSRDANRSPRIGSSRERRRRGWYRPPTSVNPHLSYSSTFSVCRRLPTKGGPHASYDTHRIVIVRRPSIPRIGSRRTTGDGSGVSQARPPRSSTAGYRTVARRTHRQNPSSVRPFTSLPTPTHPAEIALVELPRDGTGSTRRHIVCLVH